MIPGCDDWVVEHNIDKCLCYKMRLVVDETAVGLMGRRRHGMEASSLKDGRRKGRFGTYEPHSTGGACDCTKLDLKGV